MSDTQSGEGFSRRQRAGGSTLERTALGGNREERADQCCGEHQHRAEQVAAENAPA